MEEKKMKKRVLALTTAIALSVAMAVPAFAASPSTTTVMSTPVTVPATVVATKDYAMTPEEHAAVATTPEQAVALAAGVTGEVNETLEPGVLFGSLPADPTMIALTKADILKSASLQKKLAKKGVSGLIVKSGMMSYSNGKKGTRTVTLNAAGLIPGEKVALIVYVPGDPKPRLITANWKDGKLRAKMPIPCNFSIVR